MESLEPDREWSPLGASTKAPATGQEGAKPSDDRPDSIPNPPCRASVEIQLEFSNRDVCWKIQFSGPSRVFVASPAMH